MVEIVFGFGGETDDEVACDFDVCADGACEFDEFLVLLGGVTSFHKFKDTV